MDIGKQKDVDALMRDIDEKAERIAAPEPSKGPRSDWDSIRSDGLWLGDELFTEYSEEDQPDYPIERWGERGELSMLVGPAKAGKGRLLCGVACFGAIPDLNFPGLSKKAPIRTLIVVPEGFPSIKRVVKASFQRYRQHRQHLRENFHVLDLIAKGGAQLFEDSGREVIAAELRKFQGIERPVDLVIVDSISMTTDGEQIDPKIVNAACMNLKRIARDFNCAVVMAHHTNKSGIYEGSAMWLRHPVIVREIRWKEGDPWRQLTFGPCRDFDGGDDLIFRIQPISPYGPDGQNVDGLAIVDALLPPKDFDKDADAPEQPKEKRQKERLAEYAIDLLLEAPGEMTQAELVAELIKTEHFTTKDNKSRKGPARGALRRLQKDHPNVDYDADEKTYRYRRGSETPAAESGTDGTEPESVENPE